MYTRVKRAASLTPDQKLARKRRALARFKAVVRLVIANLYWMHELDDLRLGDSYVKNIQLLTRRKLKKADLTMQERSILSKPKEERTEAEKQILSKAIGGMKCFRRYPPEVKSQLAAVTYFVYIGPGRHIVKQDHPPHAMYFVLSGEASVTVRQYDKLLKEWIDKDSGTIGPGTMFGEIALIHGIQRLATITTLTPCELLMIKKEDFDLVLKETVLKAWEEIQKILNQFPYFKSMDDVTKRECSIVSRTRVFQPEETILGDGTGLSNFVHFVYEGTCCVIEHLVVTARVINGIKHYKLYESQQEEEDTQSRLERSMTLSKSLSTSRSSKATLREHRRMRESVTGPTNSQMSSGTQSKKELTRKGTLPEKQTDLTVRDKPSRISKVAIKEPQLGDVSGSKVPTIKKVLGETSSSMLNQALDESAALEKTSSIVQRRRTNVETHFIQVCELKEGGCFNIGENLDRRRIVAKNSVLCLLVPRYWIIKNNKDNIWNRVQQFLNKQIPTTEEIFKHFVEEKKFLRYRKSLVDDLLAQKKVKNSNSIHNVPYSIRLKEGTDDYITGLDY